MDDQKARRWLAEVRAAPGGTVELRPKSLARTVQIMELLLEDYPASWYYVGPAAHRTVVAAKAEIPAHQQQRISVELLPTWSPKDW